MKVSLLLLIFVALGCGTTGQAQTANSPQSPVAVSAVAWDDHELTKRDRNNFGYFSGGVRTMSVTVTNMASLPIESVRLAFVFSDPDTGEEWFRYKVHSKKKLLPGESRSIVKAALARLAVTGLPSDERAAKSAVVTEIKYSDGSGWRPE